MSSCDIPPPAFFSYKLNPGEIRAIEEAIDDVKAGRVLKMKRVLRVEELLTIARRQGLLPETGHDKKPTN